jgi:hypothetical protein
MSLLYGWLRGLQRVIELAKEVTLSMQDDDESENIKRTRIAILMLFNSRIAQLIHLWRQRRMGVFR